MKWLCVVLFCVGCSVPAPPSSPPPSTATVTEVPHYYVEYTVGDASFLIQVHFDAIVTTWQDAEAQCESNGARLPTSREWQIVSAAGFAGIDPPFYREWFRDADGAAGYWHDGGAHVGGASEPVAFRCAGGVP